MCDVVQYDPLNATVAGCATLHRLTVNTPDWNTLADTLINPALTGLYDRPSRTYTIPIKYWKESSGAIVEMTQVEKDAVDAAVPGPVPNVQYVTFAKTSLPAASPAACAIYVSDEVGGAVVAFCDGTNWRRVTDRAIVS